MRPSVVRWNGMRFCCMSAAIPELGMKELKARFGEERMAPISSKERKTIENTTSDQTVWRPITDASEPKDADADLFVFLS